MCFWALAQRASKRRRGAPDGANDSGSGSAAVAEAKDRLYLTSAPDAQGATCMISVPRALLRKHYAQSPLAVMAARPPAMQTERTVRIGTQHPTRHIWPTTLSHASLRDLKALLCAPETTELRSRSVRELLVFTEQHLLGGLPLKMAQRLQKDLSPSNVVARYTLAHGHLHLDSEGAFASLAQACHRLLAASFDTIYASERFENMQPEVQADFLAGLAPALNQRFASEGYQTLTDFRSPVLYVLRGLSPSTLHVMQMPELLHAAVAYEVPEVLRAVQRLVAPSTYMRMLSAQQAKVLRAAAYFNCQATLRDVFEGVDEAFIRHCLVRDDYALIMSVGRRGRTQALDMLLGFLPQRDIDTVCTSLKYLPSALGSQPDLDLMRWLSRRIDPLALGAMLRQPGCSVLLSAIRHDYSGIFGAYLECATQGLSFAEIQPVLLRVLNMAVNDGKAGIVGEVLGPLTSEHIRQLVTADDARLLCRLLAFGDEDIRKASWERLGQSARAMLMASFPARLCAAAVEGAHDALCMKLFVHASHALTDVNVEHPFAVAMQNERQDLALRMFDKLDETTRFHWASDPHMRVMRLAAQSGALEVIDALVAQSPGAVLGLAQADPNIDHRLLKEMLRAPVEMALMPVFEAGSPTWRKAQLRHQDFRLIAVAIEIGSPDCLQYLLSSLSEQDSRACLRQLVPQLLPNALRDRDAGTCSTLAQADVHIWTATLRQHNWALMQWFLRDNPHFVPETLQALPQDARAALWAEHGAMIMFAGLNNRRLGDYVIDHFDLAQRQAHLMAHDARLLHEAFDADAFDAAILRHVRELTLAQQREVATQSGCRMLRRMPNAAFDETIFALFAKHLNADEILGLVEGPASPGFDANLRACPLAFEQQLRQMADAQRKVVVDYIAQLLYGFGPS